MKLYETLQDCPSLFGLYKLNKSVFDRLFKATLKKGFTFKQLKEKDIIELTPKDTFKFSGTEGDKYIKLWVTIDDMIGMVTWANTMIDDKFNWNQKGKGSEKRDNSKLIGIDRFTKAYLKSNDAINMFAKVYMIPFDKLGNYKSFKEKTIKSIQADTTQDLSVISIPAIIQKVKDLLKLDLDSIKYSEPGWIWAFQKFPTDEPVLWQFEKYLPYYDYKWGRKTKSIGKLTDSRGIIIVEKNGKFVAKGGKAEFIDNFRAGASIQLIARSIDDLNAGKLFTINEIKKLVSGRKIDELDLDLGTTLIDISKIDKKMLDNTPYNNVFVDQFSGVELEIGGGSGKSSVLRYPAGCIVLKVFSKQKQLSFMEIVHSKVGNTIYVKSRLIGPKFERVNQLDKNILPAWYIPDTYEANNLLPEDKIKLFVIAKNYNDFVKYKWYSFADNIKMIENVNYEVHAEYEAEKQAAEQKANDIKVSNAEVLAAQKQYLDIANQHGAKIEAFIDQCFDDLHKMKPTNWYQVPEFWKFKLQDLTKLIWRGNPSVVNGVIANFTGSYYAGEMKNGVQNLKNLWGAPGTFFSYNYIDESYKIKEFNKWVEKGWPKERRPWFLQPSTVIICNGGRIGIVSSGVSPNFCENWHFSTNDGKNANGTISLKTDKIALAIPNAKDLKLYIFK